MTTEIAVGYANGTWRTVTVKGRPSLEATMGDESEIIAMLPEQPYDICFANILFVHESLNPQGITNAH